MKLTEELKRTVSDLRRSMSLLRRKAEHKLEGTPTHLYIKCQCYCYDDTLDRMHAYYGYMRLEDSGAVLENMIFVDSQGQRTAFENNPLCKIGIKPVNGMLFSMRQIGAVNGIGFNRFVDTREQNTLYCYTLDKNGKASGRHSAVRSNEKLMEYSRCYLVTDNERTFAAYLQVGKNELWEFPIG